MTKRYGPCVEGAGVHRNPTPGPAAQEWVYGRVEAKRCKTFLAAWPPAGGVIRVVLVQNADGWVAYFCTDASATAADILGLVSNRANALNPP